MTFGELLEHFRNTFEKIIVYFSRDHIQDVLHKDDDEYEETLKIFYPHIVDDWCCCNRENVLKVYIPNALRDYTHGVTVKCEEKEDGTERDAT